MTARTTIHNGWVSVILQCGLKQSFADLTTNTKYHIIVTGSGIHGIDFPWPVALAVLQHHERLNGSGYPNRLSGDSIILEARVLAVSDVVEAMASHRPYRPALGIDKALEEISQKRGSLYDSAVVDACLKLFKEKNFSLEQTMK